MQFVSIPIAVYGAVPSFLFSTATSANPHEHSMVNISLK